MGNLGGIGSIRISSHYSTVVCRKGRKNVFTKSPLNTANHLTARDLLLELGFPSSDTLIQYITSRRRERTTP